MEDAKLTQHLEEMHVKHRAQAKAKRMAFERRRLAKVAQEKRRKEKEEAEKPKDRTRNGLLRSAVCLFVPLSSLDSFLSSARFHF